MNDLQSLLQTITALSHEFGTPGFVKGGGGNTSVKQGGTIWIKPSGTTLAGLAPAQFVAVDRALLGRLYEAAVPSDAAAREAMVKDLMMAAVSGGSRGRPSVETPLHDLLAGRFVVHTHAVLVNGMTCGREGRMRAAELFPDALWIPYVDPGFTLSMYVRERVLEHAERTGRQPAVILLENHGIFVSGDTPDEIRASYQVVLEPLRRVYARAGVPLELTLGAAATTDIQGRLAEELRNWSGQPAVVYGGNFEPVAGPLSPDHMVYAKAYPFTGARTAENLEAFRKRHGYLPRIVQTEAGVFGIGSAEKQAALAVELARDAAQVRQLAKAFGGIQFMSDTARQFIESWEVESYREQQMRGQG